MSQAFEDKEKEANETGKKNLPKKKIEEARKERNKEKEQQKVEV